MGRKRKHDDNDDEARRKIKKYQKKIEKLQRRPSPAPIQTPPTPSRAGSPSSIAIENDLFIVEENENKQEGKTFFSYLVFNLNSMFGHSQQRKTNMAAGLSLI